ncbi:MAG: sigma-70 family RNA polymerase sigma factor [Planctomycetaceae bacterium]
MELQSGTRPESLVARARGGDTVALGTLLEQYRAYLTLMARLEIGRRLQGKADPTDVVQDAFLEAARCFHQFRGTTEPELSAWLRQILATRLSHLVRRFYGTKVRDVRLEQALRDELDHSSRAFEGGFVARQSSPSAQASRRELGVLLADALEVLPPDYREVIVLRHLEGLTFPEVARRMERSLDSVEKLWARALSRLKRALGAMR